MISMNNSPYSKIKPESRLPYTTIYLIRHANPDYSLEESLGDQFMPLSKYGVKQANWLANSLVKKEIDTIYSSELQRAKETAEHFAKLVNKKIKINQRLNEINWINWHRIKYFNTCEKNRPTKLKDYKVLDKKLDQYQAEGRRLLWDLFRKNKGKRVAVFCHGNIIKSIITSIINADVIGFLSIEIFQSSITKVLIDRDAYVKINQINDVSHLPTTPSEDLFKTLLAH